ncbi:LD-carboxypeptidase [Actinocatenispora rupis]|uniref:Peptidase S66 n=1 Tax=Actinocatenispora rupis TaxID=519421 RepID=A0A8J3J5M4_9ACTN|nr:peptidase S66 [Actinocatenispora rupis]
MARAGEAWVAAVDAALRDPRVRAVVTPGPVPDHRIVERRGGRLVDRIDLPAACRDPKLVIGVATRLHLALWRAGRIPTVYGEPTTALRPLVTGAESVTLHRDRAVPSGAVSVAGRAEGTLLGGSLAGLRGTLGVDPPRLDGALLYLTDPRVIGLGEVDRQLTQVRRSGLLDGVRGVVLGRFPGFDGYEDRGWTLVDVLADRLTDLGVPVLGGVTAPVPLGVSAALDATAGTLTVAPVAT